MNFQRRKTVILELLEDREMLEVREFSQHLGVSEITVRRDLNVLAEKGFIQRTHGGAMSLKSSRDKVDFVAKVSTRNAEKEYIAQIASRFIQDGDALFLDCGSTVYCLAPYLKGKQVKVITNSLPLAHALLSSGVSINLIGGEVDVERMAVHGAMAAQHITRYKADKAFVGVDGISLQGGLSSNSEKEAEITLAMASHSRQVFLLCDSSKLENDRYLQFAPLTMTDYLITDSGAEASVIQSYRNEGIQVVQ